LEENGVVSQSGAQYVARRLRAKAWLLILNERANQKSSASALAATTHDDDESQCLRHETLCTSTKDRITILRILPDNLVCCLTRTCCSCTNLRIFLGVELGLSCTARKIRSNVADSWPLISMDCAVLKRILVCGGRSTSALVSWRSFFCQIIFRS
jgi:hypothetical protein